MEVFQILMKFPTKAKRKCIDHCKEGTNFIKMGEESFHHYKARRRDACNFYHHVTKNRTSRFKEGGNISLRLISMEFHAFMEYSTIFHHFPFIFMGFYHKWWNSTISNRILQYPMEFLSRWCNSFIWMDSIITPIYSIKFYNVQWNFTISNGILSCLMEFLYSYTINGILILTIEFCHTQ